MSDSQLYGFGFTLQVGWDNPPVTLPTRLKVTVLGVHMDWLLDGPDCCIPGDQEDGQYEISAMVGDTFGTSGSMGAQAAELGPPPAGAAWCATTCVIAGESTTANPGRAHLHPARPRRRRGSPGRRARCGPAHLAGIGVGGVVAQIAALDHPGAFSAPTLAGTRAVAPGKSDADLPNHDKATMKRLFTRAMPDWTDRAAAGPGKRPRVSQYAVLRADDPRRPGPVATAHHLRGSVATLVGTADGSAPRVRDADGTLRAV